MKDLNTRATAAANSNPARHVQVGDRLYFWALVNDPGVLTNASRFRLHVTDGTPEGTRALPCDPLPFNTGPRDVEMTACGGRLFLSVPAVEYGSRARSLWVTDGTAGGTVLVRAPGPVSPFDPARSEVSSLFDLDGSRVLFVCRTQATGYEVWVSDGTPAGTRMVREIHPFGSAFPAFSDAQEFTRLGPYAVFAAEDGTTGSEPWRTDGTAAGTVLLRDIGFESSGQAGSGFRAIGVAGGSLLFSAAAASGNDELWRTDGTPAGTTLLKEINPGAGGSFAVKCGELPGGLVLEAGDGAGREPWFSDGTPAGTYRLADINAGLESSSPRRLAGVGGAVLFNAWSPASGWEVWRTNGTVAGTGPLADLSPGPADTWVAGAAEYDASRAVFFGASSATREWRLYVTDGTPAGTAAIATLPGSGGLSAAAARARLADGSLLLAEVRAAVGGSPTTTLWRTDGTEAGTRRIASFESTDTSTTPAAAVPVASGRLVFSVYRWTPANRYRAECWATDGTEGGAFRLDPPGTAGALEPDRPFEIGFSVGGRAVFSADDGARGIEPWVSDGTPEGTRVLADVRVPNATADGAPASLVALGDRLLFSSVAAGGVRTLYGTDGTPEGTADLLAGVGVGYSGDAQVAVVGGRAYFFGALSADPAVTRVFSTDGTPAGTREEAPVGQFDGGIFPVGDRVALFNPYAVGSGVAFYDPRAAPGAALVEAPAPAAIGAFSTNGEPLPIGGRLYFVRFAYGRFEQPIGGSICSTDGGRVRRHTLADEDPMTTDTSCEPRELVAVGGKIFYRDRCPATGDEVHVLDPVSGAVTVLDLAPGPAGSFPSQLTDAGDLLVFHASTEAHGSQVWVSDGTVAGTRPLLTPLGQGWSGTGEFVRIGTRGLFAALSGEAGTLDVYGADLLEHGPAGRVDAAPGPDFRYVVSLTRVGNGERAVVSAEVLDGETGVYTHGLFATDGTPAGTRPLPGPASTGIGSPYPFPVGVRGCDAYYVMETPPATGARFWRTDGTVAGTAAVSEGGGGGRMTFDTTAPVFAGSTLYYAAWDPAHGAELWALDTGAGACRADVDASGTLTIDDLFAFLSLWFAGDARADFDGESGVGVADIFVFLCRWFEGCG